jgi:hypothetical protein
MSNWIAPVIGIVLMACPLAYPGFPLLLWRFLFWGGLAILIFWGLYNFFTKLRLTKEVKLIPLIMIIGGFMLIAGGIIYHLHDSKLIENKIIDKPTIEKQTFSKPNLKGEDIKTLIDTKSKAELPELEKLFPGGFVPFAVLIGGSATAGHNIIRSSTTYNIDITWGNAAITELTPASLILQLENLRIIRTKTTPGGIQPAGEININGSAVWQIDRTTKLVYINSAIVFWGYVLGGRVLLDTNDAIVIAIGLQRVG